MERLKKPSLNKDLFVRIPNPATCGPKVVTEMDGIFSFDHSVPARTLLSLECWCATLGEQMAQATSTNRLS